MLQSGFLQLTAKSFFAVILSLFLVSCKYDNFNKVVKAAGIEVYRESGKSDADFTCTRIFLEELDNRIYRYSKKQRAAFVNQLKNKNIKKIQFFGDKQVQKNAGDLTSLFYVESKSRQIFTGTVILGQAQYRTEYYIEEKGSKKLVNTVVITGKKPEVKLALVNDTISIYPDSGLNVSTSKKLYTKSLDTYDNVETLEDAIKYSSIEHNSSVWKPADGSVVNNFVYCAGAEAAINQLEQLVKE